MAKYNRFIKENCAPDNAAKIGIFQNGSFSGKTIPLGGLSRGDIGIKQYSFAVFSDVHRDPQSNDAFDRNEDLNRALEFCKNKVDFISMCGDLTLGGFESELKALQTAIKNKGWELGTNVYTCAGNHEVYGRNWTTTNYNMSSKNWGLTTEPKALQDYWTACTGMDKHTAISKGNDVFIFFSPDSGVAYNNPSYRNESDSDIRWLYNTLKTNRNKRCFVFTHFFFPSMSGDYGGRATYYSAPMDSESERQMTLLLKKYKNAIWFSGHSHFVWECQGKADKNGNSNYDANVAKNDDTCYCVHIPSLGQPRVPTTDTSGNYSFYDESNSSQSGKNIWLSPVPTSQFAIVDVYDSCIIIKGLSYIGGAYKYLPIAQYKIPTTYEYVNDADIDFSTTNGNVLCYYISNTVRTADGWLEFNGSKVITANKSINYTVRFFRYKDGDSAEMVNTEGVTQYSFRKISSYSATDDTYTSISNQTYTFDSNGRMLLSFPESGMYRIKQLYSTSSGVEIGTVLIVNIQ